MRALWAVGFLCSGVFLAWAGSDGCALCGRAHAAAIKHPEVALLSFPSLVQDPQLTDVQHYDLTLEVVPNTQTLIGSCLMRVKVRQPTLNAFRFRLRENFLITALRLDGRPDFVRAREHYHRARRVRPPLHAGRGVRTARGLSGRARLARVRLDRVHDALVGGGDCGDAEPAPTTPTLGGPPKTRTPTRRRSPSR
jgi:hypothetical protein